MKVKRNIHFDFTINVLLKISIIMMPLGDLFGKWEVSLSLETARRYKYPFPGHFLFPKELLPRLSENLSMVSKVLRTRCSVLNVALSRKNLLPYPIESIFTFLILFFCTHRSKI